MIFGLDSIYRFLRLLRPYKYFIIKALLVGVILSVIAAPVPLLTKVLVDSVLPDRDYHLLLIVVLGIAFINIGSRLLNVFSTLFGISLGLKMSLDIHLSFIEHLQSLSFSFYDHRKAGEVLSRSRDADVSLSSTLSMIFEFIVNVLSLIIFPPILFALNWKLALLSIMLLPLSALLFYFLNRIVYRISRKIAEVRAELSALEYESISGIRTIQALGIERYIFGKIMSTLGDAQNESLRLSNYQQWGGFIAAAVGIAGTFIYSYYGWRWILDGALTLGSFLAFTTYVGYLQNPIQRLIGLSQRIQQTLVHTNRFFDVYDLTPEVRDRDGSVDLHDVRGEIAFRDVAFRYRTGETILSRANFTVAAGENAALIGKSGAGKTTIFNLIARFYDATAGAVTIDGMDVRSIRLASLRSKVGIMMQEPFLFYGTIAENIACGDGYERAAIERAARIARADEFIACLSGGFETVIGEKGAKLSVGQKQKIVLARIILRDYPVILLDEPSASWDVEGEQEILQSIRTYAAKKTTVVISHRLTSVMKADKILYLGRNGMLTVLESYDELLENRAIFEEVFGDELFR